MATEGQLAALRSWLKQEIPTGEAVCEMPGEICSDALSRLHEASEAYNKDKKKYNGIVGKTKKKIVSELREQGYIDVQIGVNETIVPDAKAPAATAIPVGKSEHVDLPNQTRGGSAPTTIPTPATEDATARSKAEIQTHGLRMQFAVREAVRITMEEVGEKIPNQGLAGFVKDIAICLFREARLEGTQSSSSSGGEKEK